MWSKITPIVVGSELTLLLSDLFIKLLTYFAIVFILLQPSVEFSVSKLVVKYEVLNADFCSESFFF